MRHTILQDNTLNALYDILAIEIFEVKDVYTIYHRTLLSRHYGILKFKDLFTIF